MGEEVKIRKGMLVKYEGKIWVVTNDKLPYKLRYPIPEILIRDEGVESYCKGIGR